MNLQGTLYSRSKRWAGSPNVAGLSSADGWDTECFTPASVSVDPEKHYKLSLDMCSAECNPDLPRLEAPPLWSLEIGWEFGEPEENLEQMLAVPTATDQTAMQNYLPRLALTSLADLRELRFVCCKGFTDNCFKHLANLRQLQTLQLCGTSPLTLAGFRQAPQLTNLRALELSYSPVTDDALGYLHFCGQLSALQMHFCGISDLALHHIGSLVNLHSLHLKEDTITDQGLATAAGAG